MVDPLTALSVATTAVNQMKQLINAGRDTSAALSKFAGAWADLNEAERRAKNPPWYKAFNSSLEQEAAQAFAAKKKAQALKKELESIIQYMHGPSGLREYKDILRNMREQKRKNEYRKQAVKDAILTWTFGILITLVGVSGLAVLFYFIGVQQGKW